MQADPLPRRVIGVATSAGGVEPLLELAAGLPADFDAAVCVVLHIPATPRTAQRFRTAACEADERAALIRSVLGRHRDVEEVAAG